MEGENFSMEVTVPVGCQATVYVPAGKNRKVLENGQVAADSDFVQAKGEETGYKIFAVGSGNYRFEVE
jgi:hypothetical protein